MRAQMDFRRAQKGTEERAQGTDWAQIEKSICALGSLCFYSFIYLKGTKAQNKYNPQDIYKKGKYRSKGSKQGSAKRVWRISINLCPVPSTAFRERVA